MKKICLSTFLFLLFAGSVLAQFKAHPPQTTAINGKRTAASLRPVQQLQDQPSPPVALTRPGEPAYQSIANFKPPRRTVHRLHVLQRSDEGLPIMIKGQFPLAVTNRSSSLPEQAFLYLNQAGELMGIGQPEEEFRIRETHRDEFGESHLRMQQYYRGIEVFGGSLLLHTKKDKISLLNGRYFPTPEMEALQPALSEAEVRALVRQKLQSFTVYRPFSDSEKKLIPRAQFENRLLIYHRDFKADGERLAWGVSVYATPVSKWFFVIDALTGKELLRYREQCTLHGKFADPAVHSRLHAEKPSVNHVHAPAPSGGPAKVNSTDLYGITRTLDVWENNGIFHMIDASKSMYNAGKSDLPASGRGIIATLDAKNRKPSVLGGYSASDVTSAGNDWTTLAVSAHYNSSVVYDYFDDTFGRNSIDGKGGNMISLINVVDESGAAMDNAFYADGNMYYGNGAQAFDPLAKSLDVAAHEISHGVVANTANLIYLQQAGALNESFADVFGVLVDREDWQLGEDVVRSQFFPSGALRDMANPNNGVNRQHHAWQPGHMDEFVTLPDSEDNGGVHINSGIPNKAFHLFASTVGLEKAEQVYYKALRDYLTRSSQFIDCRLAVIQAAVDIYGSSSAEVSAAASAFDGVGIFGDGNTTTPNDYQEDVQTNPGTDWIFMTDTDFGAIYMSDLFSVPAVSQTDVLSKISITDEGRFALFIAADKTMKSLEVDWNQIPPEITERTIQDEQIWRNVAISKDGQRLAALTEDGDNQVFIYNFPTAEWKSLTLKNPTTAQGISSTNVLYADVLEWDFSGEFVLYDAFNSIPKDDSPDIEFWDIGFLRAWDQNRNEFGDGLILKLISDLPENTSIGNPTFSKNSPYILAFDFIDDEDQNFILGANVETGDIGTIYENSVIAYPNYSRMDDEMIFDAETTNNEKILAILKLENDKINGTPNTAKVLVSGGKWGVWFAPGFRDFSTSTGEEAELSTRVRIFPNPFREEITIEMEEAPQALYQLRLFNLMGQELLRQDMDQKKVTLAGTRLPPGSYWLRITDGRQSLTKKLIRF